MAIKSRKANNVRFRISAVKLILLVWPVVRVLVLNLVDGFIGDLLRVDSTLPE